ncbi:hypothetical protein GCM10009608_32380 [Pseudonocardia alaniniphila]
MLFPFVTLAAISFCAWQWTTSCEGLADTVPLDVDRDGRPDPVSVTGSLQAFGAYARTTGLARAPVDDVCLPLPEPSRVRGVGETSAPGRSTSAVAMIGDVQLSGSNRAAYRARYSGHP